MCVGAYVWCVWVSSPVDVAALDARRGGWGLVPHICGVWGNSPAGRSWNDVNLYGAAESTHSTGRPPLS